MSLCTKLYRKQEVNHTKAKNHNTINRIHITGLQDQNLTSKIGALSQRPAYNAIKIQTWRKTIDYLTSKIGAVSQRAAYNARKLQTWRETIDDLATRRNYISITKAHKNQNPRQKRTQKVRKIQETREINKIPEKVKPINTKITGHLPRVEGLDELPEIIALGLEQIELDPKQLPI